MRPADDVDALFAAKLRGYEVARMARHREWDDVFEHAPRERQIALIEVLNRSDDTSLPDSHSPKQ